MLGHSKPTIFSVGQPLFQDLGPPNYATALKKPVLESLFNNVASLQVFRCFLVNIEKVLRINFLKEHLRTAASEGSFYVKKINYHLFRIKIQTE